MSVGKLSISLVVFVSGLGGSGERLAVTKFSHSSYKVKCWHDARGVLQVLALLTFEW